MSNQLDPIILVPHYWEEISMRVGTAIKWLTALFGAASIGGMAAVGLSVWFSSWVLLAVGFVSALLAIYAYHTREICGVVVIFANQLGVSLRRAENMTDLSEYPIPVPEEVLENLLGRSAN